MNKSCVHKSTGYCHWNWFTDWNLSKPEYFSWVDVSHGVNVHIKSRTWKYEMQIIKKKKNIKNPQKTNKKEINIQSNKHYNKNLKKITNYTLTVIP